MNEKFSSANHSADSTQSTSPCRSNVSGNATVSESIQDLQVQRKNWLNNKHYQELTVKRGLNAAWVEANCRTVDKEEASTLLGYPAKSGGIWIEGANGRGQLKPDRPWKSKEDSRGKAPKYRSPSGEYGGFLPKHPTESDYWTNTEKLKERCWQMDNKPCLNVTEGPLKAIQMCADGMPTIALPGVEMGLTSKKANIQGRRYLVLELEWAASIGVEINIIFDADAATNDDVVKAQLNLARKWQEVTGRQAYSCTGLWKEGEGKGVDDYIQANGADKFKREVLAKALTLDAWEKQFVGVNDNDYKQKVKPPTPRKIAEELAEEYRPKWAFHHEQGTWRTWNEKCWEALDDERFGDRVHLALKARNIAYESDNYVESVVKTLRRELRVERWVTFDRKRYVAFDSGVLDMETGELLDHSPGMRFTSYIPRQYSILHDLRLLHPLDALKQVCPHTYGYITKAMGGDRQRVMKLLAIVNAVLKWRLSEFQMFVHLIGEPGAGKGTFIRLLQGLVGKPNHSSATLGKLSDDYTIANIIDSQLVVCPDEDRKNGNHGGLKALTGGDNISYREIYKKPASSPFYGGLVVVSNTAIFTGDTTGLERRLCLASFSNRLAAHERNPKIEELIDSELSALTAVALLIPDTQVEELIKGIGAGEIPEFMAQSWRMITETNSAGLHLEERLVSDPTAYTEVSKLYDSYRHLCEEFGRVPMEKVRYSQEIVRIASTQLGWAVSRDRISRDGKLQRIIRGMRFRLDGCDDHIPLPSEVFAGQTAQTAHDSTMTAPKNVLSTYENKDSSLDRQHLTKNFISENSSRAEAEENSEVNIDSKNDDAAVTPEPQGFDAVQPPVTELSVAVAAVSEEVESFVLIARELIKIGCDWETYQAAMMKDSQLLPADIRKQVWMALSPDERHYITALKIAATTPENVKQMTLDINKEEIRQDSRCIKSHDGEEHWA